MTAAHGQLSLQFMVIVPTVQIASLGMADSLILMVMALVVFGPRRLPQIGRQIGKLMYEFRKASNDFKFQMEEERLRALALAAPAPAPAEALTPALTAGTETPAADALTAETVNPAAIYDNGPVAMTQAADTAPTIMPPSIGETVAAARGWSLKHEQARLAEASKAVAAPATVATELRAPTSESDPAPSAPAGSESAPPETITAEPASSEAHPDAAAQPPGIAVNHHG